MRLIRGRRCEICDGRARWRRTSGIRMCRLCVAAMESLRAKLAAALCQGGLS